MTNLIFLIAVGFTVFSIVALAIAPMFARPSALDQRLAEAVTIHQVADPGPGSKERLEETVSQLARATRARFGMSSSVQTTQRLEAAGYRSPSAPDLFFAVQFLTPLAGIFGASFLPDNTMFWMVCLGGVGYLAPSIWLNNKIKSRRERIRRALPDTVDLLVICVDAGLGLDQGVLRVCEELAVSHPDIQEELNRVNLEQRAGKQRMDAWQHMAERVKVPDFGAFVSMLLQADRFGTPIAKALTNFAAELRLKRRQIAEEAAAKTKIKIIFPLVFCIFPCLFIVLLAPAILAITRGLNGMAH